MFKDSSKKNSDNDKIRVHTNTYKASPLKLNSTSTEEVKVLSTMLDEFEAQHEDFNFTFFPENFRNFEVSFPEEEDSIYMKLRRLASPTKITYYLDFSDVDFAESLIVDDQVWSRRNLMAQCRNIGSNPLGLRNDTLASLYFYYFLVRISKEYSMYFNYTAFFPNIDNTCQFGDLIPLMEKITHPATLSSYRIIVCADRYPSVDLFSCGIRSDLDSNNFFILLLDHKTKTMISLTNTSYDLSFYKKKQVPMWVLNKLQYSWTMHSKLVLIDNSSKYQDSESYQSLLVFYHLCCNTKWIFNMGFQKEVNMHYITSNRFESFMSEGFWKSNNL